MGNWGPANVASAFITPMLIDTFGPGVTLLFFGGVSMLVVPFAATCLPETKGRTLEEVVPLFRFAGWQGFRKFVHGNLRGGLGAQSVQELKHVTSSSVPHSETKVKTDAAAGNADSQRCTENTSSA